MRPRYSDSYYHAQASSIHEQARRKNTILAWLVFAGIVIVCLLMAERSRDEKPLPADAHDVQAHLERGTR